MVMKSTLRLIHRKIQSHIPQFLGLMLLLTIGVYTASVSKCHCVILRAIKNRVVSRVFEVVRYKNLASLETTGLESKSDFVRRK